MKSVLRLFQRKYLLSFVVVIYNQQVKIVLFSLILKGKAVMFFPKLFFLPSHETSSTFKHFMASVYLHQSKTQ